jgi:bis(5'-nucleosyl)-tetraphosphatase (symmetrical)
MATWAIGDVHGCYRTLRALLRALPFDARRDRLWLVGDLVARGPRTLDTLRFLSDPALGATAVLGNHDLHLLASVAGLARPRAKDRLAEMLAAHDRDELFGWLAQRPLAVRATLRREPPAEAGRETFMVHAGLLPSWDLDRAERRAHRAEECLRGPKRDALLAAWRGAEATKAVQRDAETLDVLCRLRALDAKGLPLRGFAGALAELPRGAHAWFDAPDRAADAAEIVCGHWAALGLYIRADVLALDSGCVWRRALTAVRLEDRRVVQQPYAD